MTKIVGNNMKSVALHNLGCKVNAYELEVIGQKLQEKGYDIVSFDKKADIYIVNTCTVTNIADRKSRQMLHRAKKMNPDAVVVAVGCYVQAGKEEALLDGSIDLAVGNTRVVAEKIHTIWQAKRSNERQLTIVRPGVVFGKGENGNFTRLYWGIRGGKFFYPGRKDTIKACIYVKELVRFMLYRLENHSEGVELYNCTFEPAFTIEQIVETMKKATGLQRTIVKVPGSLLMTVASIVGPLGGKALGICPARVKKLMISTNICGKKLADSGYKFHYTFEEAIKDWYRDNDGQCLR